MPPTANASPDDRDRVLPLLRRHGWNATSFQALEPGLGYFFDGDDACVAYVDTGRAWVAAGAPIAAPERIASVATRFVAAARAAGRRACFFATEDRFAAVAEMSALPVGEQPRWDPTTWDAALAQSRSLREQLRRARAKGVTVRRLAPTEVAEGAPTRVAVDELIDRWLVSRSMAPMGFLVQVHPFAYVEERRYFVAELGGRVVGFLGVVPIFARGGWFLEDLLRDPSAPNGTAELLCDAAMRAAADEGSHYATLGLAPLGGDVSSWMRAARRVGGTLYDFDGVRAFKAKLRPNGWDPIYLLVPKGQGTIAAILDVLHAFSRGGFFRFGLETLLRGPAVVVRLLALLLVPWTLLLAFSASAAHFPAPWVKWAWVGFDVALVAPLLALSRRWRPRLGTLLAWLVTADAATTLGEALAYNVPRLRGVGDLVMVLLAVLAPALAAFVLWRARAHRAGAE